MSEVVEPKPLLSNRTYDVLKYLAQIVLPAAGTFYFALSQIWGLPYGDEVVGTIVAVDTLLGVLLGFSSSNYQGKTQGAQIGDLVITETETGKNMELNFPGDPHEIEMHDRVTFKVRKQ